MRNRVEILRALEYTKDSMVNILNLDEIDSYEDIDFEFMEEFKKIYELGLTQLEEFINKLNDEGKDLDVYSIKYYTEVLLNGPLGNYVRELSEGKLYFIDTPDSMGLMGNKLRSNQNSVLIKDTPFPLGCAVDTFNKLPDFIQSSLQKSTEESEKLFRSNLDSSIVNDNTLPIVDKRNQDRINQESSGSWQVTPNGNYNLKDPYFYRVLDNISERIFSSIKNYLGDENFRLYKDYKEYNKFSNINDSTSKNWKVNTLIEEDGKEEEIPLDIYGNVIDSTSERGKLLKITNDSGSKEYNLGSNNGQLGN